MDHFGQTKFGVFTLGGIAAALILWLSVSFWLDAWDQRQGARQLDQTADLETRLLAVTRDVASERRAAIEALSETPSTPEQERATLDALQRQAVQTEGLLDGVVEAIEAALQDPLLTAGFRFSPDALDQTLVSLDATRRGFTSQRSKNAQRLSAPIAGDPYGPASAARERAMRRTHTRATRLIDKLHELNDGLYVEARINVRSVKDLRRLRTDLRDFAEYAARASELRYALRSPRVTGGRNREESWSSNLAAANVRVGEAIQRLRIHQSDAMLSVSLLRELSMLVEMASAGVSGRVDSGRPEVMQALADMDQHIASNIAADIAEVEAHAHRRLFIDSLLIAVCFWIAITCLRLLRNIQHQAWHDRLTDLVNRNRFEQLLDARLDDAENGRRTLAVIVLGIDSFTSINSRVGHSVGDTLLCMLARRLDESLSLGQTMGALGGDNFAVLLPDATSAEAVMSTAKRLHREGGKPFIANGASLQITLSLGFSLSEPGDDVCGARVPARELLQQAEVAMRQAKDEGRDRVHRFDRAMAERNRENIELEGELRHAIDNDELQLHYQPKVCMRSGRVDGVEALLRWVHPQRGMVSPGLFIPIAERGGLIPAIGDWVLQDAIRFTSRWNRENASGLQVAVNVSPQQFVENGFVARIHSLLDEHGLDADHLELEVTESVGMLDMELVVDKLQRLRASGISIAIDDFGTDYSSLQYLEILPLDKLKIDRAFIRQLDGGKGRSLARTIIMMAESLELQTVAEGVETTSQLEKIVALGCDYVQGYYYSRPVSADELSAAVKRIEIMTAEAFRPAA